MNKLIVLIGCGRWGKNILRDLQLLDVNIVVIDPDSKARQYAQQQGINDVFKYLKDFLAEKKACDGFIIAASSKQHYELLLMLSKLNKPVFVEKPMVLALEDAQHLEKIMGDRLFVMHKWRYHPGILALKQLIKQGEFHALKEIRTKRHGLAFDYDIPGYRILLPHDLSIILEFIDFLPEPEQTNAYVHQQKLTGVSVDFKTTADLKVNISVCSDGQPFEREIMLKFSDAIALLTDNDYHNIYLYDNQKTLIKKIPVSLEQPLYEELKAFMGYLCGGDSPKSDIKDALKVINCTEQLLKNLQLHEKGFYEYQP